MVKQGDIIMVDFNPQRGHEKAGYRPAVIVSNNFFNRRSNLVLACPITTTKRNFPLHVCLDYRTEIKGSILCEQLKAIDLRARTYKIIEPLPKDLLDKVINIIIAEIEPSN